MKKKLFGALHKADVKKETKEQENHTNRHTKFFSALKNITNTLDTKIINQLQSMSNNDDALHSIIQSTPDLEQTLVAGKLKAETQIEINDRLNDIINFIKNGGVEKTNSEIPGFENTMGDLDNLSIRKGMQDPALGNAKKINEFELGEMENYNINEQGNYHIGEEPEPHPIEDDNEFALNLKYLKGEYADKSYESLIGSKNSFQKMADEIQNRDPNSRRGDGATDLKLALGLVGMIDELISEMGITNTSKNKNPMTNAIGDMSAEYKLTDKPNSAGENEIWNHTPSKLISKETTKLNHDLGLGNYGKDSRSKNYKG